jgi:quinol monooxygenase YgiN|nr:antibiotic biosynthesis monooxygenase family protein [Variovorax sp. S12S4]
MPRAVVIDRHQKSGASSHLSSHEPEQIHVTTIAEKTGFVTLINVFTVEPANQSELLTLLARATDTSVRNVPGFVSAALHRSVDGTKVTMYAQWESAEHYQAMRSNPVASPFLDQALAIAKFDPGMYEVVKVFSAPPQS